MDVNAYTTLDTVEAVARGHGWSEDGLGTLNVSDSDDGAIVLEYEMDSMSVENLPQHAVVLKLSEEEAMRLAEEIEETVDGLGATAGE